MNGANQDLKSSENAISSFSKEIEEKRAQAKSKRLLHYMRFHRELRRVILELERQISTKLDDYELPEGMIREQVTLPWLIEDSARELAQTQKYFSSRDWWYLGD